MWWNATFEIWLEFCPVWKYSGLEMHEVACHGACGREHRSVLRMHPYLSIPRRSIIKNARNIQLRLWHRITRLAISIAIKCRSRLSTRLESRRQKSRKAGKTSWCSNMHWNMHIVWRYDNDGRKSILFYYIDFRGMFNEFINIVFEQQQKRALSIKYILYIIGWFAIISSLDVQSVSCALFQRTN